MSSSRRLSVTKQDFVTTSAVETVPAPPADPLRRSKAQCGRAFTHIDLPNGGRDYVYFGNEPHLQESLGDTTVGKVTGLHPTLLKPEVEKGPTETSEVREQFQTKKLLKPEKAGRRMQNGQSWVPSQAIGGHPCSPVLPQELQANLNAFSRAPINGTTPLTPVISTNTILTRDIHKEREQVLTRDQKLRHETINSKEVPSIIPEMSRRVRNMGGNKSKIFAS